MERSSDGFRLTTLLWLTSLVIAADDVTTTPPMMHFADVATCADAGYSGAYVNECGYCVQGVTGLSRDFGRDCAGGCGTAYVDCAGKCNGFAYVDECDGKCVESTSRLMPRTALGPSPIDFLQVRDCRGLCPLVHNEQWTNDTVTYANDGCGVCISMNPTLERSAVVIRQPQMVRLDTNQTVVNRVFETSNALGVRLNEPPLAPSDYRDCSGTCFAPATVHLMAINSSDTCDQCWGPRSSSMGFLDLKDECGHCRKDHMMCSCPLLQQDLCGVCNGSNDSCVTIVSAFPLVIPSSTQVNVKILGVALMNRHSTVCMLIRKDIGADGKDEDRFPAVVQGVDITCDVTLPQGIYELRLAVINTIDNQVLDMSNSSFPFIVYSQSAMFNSLTPSTVPVLTNATNFTVVLNGQSLDRMKTVYCTINGSGYDTPVKVESSPVFDSMANCTFPLPSKSFTANVTVSLDGTNRFAGPFAIRFVTPPPYVTDAYTFPEGDSLVIYFNRDIDSSVSTRKNCDDYLTSSTVMLLGPNTTCSWVTKRQLLIELGPSVRGLPVPSSNSTPDDDNETAVVIVFQDNLLRVDNETFAETASAIELSFFMSDETPIAVLAGPNLVPSCGKFTLDGHQSILIQNRRVTFLWAVNTVEPNVTSRSLLNVIEETNRRNVAWMTLDALLLEAEVDYEFSLTIFNSRRDSIINSSSSSPPFNVARLNVMRSSHLVPLVVIEPNLASYPKSVTTDQSFILHTFITIPRCQREIFALNYNWTISNPKVKMDLHQLNGDSYLIAPYTLPVGENVTMTLLVTLNNDHNMSSQSSIEFTTAPSQIKSYIEGGFRRFIGNGSGELVLNASKSYHPDLPALPLVYRWECLEDGDKPCYNYDESSNEVLLLNQPITRQPVLSIPTRKLRPGKVMMVTLVAISPLDPTAFSLPKTVSVTVLNGSGPIVSIMSLMPMDDRVTKPEMEDMVHLIPSMTDVIVTAKVSYLSSIKHLEWFIEGLNLNLSSHMTKHKVEKKVLETTVIIPRDYLMAKGLYELGLRARDETGNEGVAYEAFTILPSVSGCVVTIPDYEAFQMVTVTLEHCVADDGSYPLSYEVHVYKGKHLISLSPSEFHLPLEIMGPPDMMNSSVASGSNVFSVQVCDALSNCHWFNSSRVGVRAASNLQATAEHAFFMARIAKLQGDYLACLRRHVLYLEAVTPPYRYRHEMEYESQMAEAFLCARMAADVQCRGSNCFDDLFTLMTSINIENGPGRDFILIEVVERAVNRIEAERLHLSTAGVQEAFYVLEKIYKFNVSNLDIANRVVQMEAALQRILARSLRPGESSVLTNSEGRLLAALTYTLLNNTFEVDMLPSSTKSNQTVKLEFDRKLKKKYSSWECEVNSSTCHGMVAELLLFPDAGLQPVDVVFNRTVSSVVQVVMLNPLTGDRIDDKTYVTLTLLANGSQLDSDLQYECYTWQDISGGQWSTEGVDTEVVNKTIFHCGTDRPSYFVVIGHERRFTGGEIAGIVLGVLGAVALIGLVAFFFYKKARTKTMRVSISKGYSS